EFNPLDVCRRLCDGGEPRQLWLDEEVNDDSWIRMMAAAETGRRWDIHSRKNGSFIANWIQNQNYTKKIWEVLGIPMGKKKLESDSPRDFNDEFLIAFKKQFEDKNFIWDHIKQARLAGILQNWYYGPNTVLMNDEDDVGHANHGDVHANGNDEVDFAEENEANEMGVDAEKSVKEAAENKKPTKQQKRRKEKIEAAKKNKQAAQKEKKEKAEKEAAEKKKAEMQKAATEKKEQAEIQAAAEAKFKDKMHKDAEEKKQSLSKKKEKINLNRLLKKATTVPKSFESLKVQQKMFEKGEVVFDDGKGTLAHKKEMQSLAPGIEIEKQIIDTLVTVLNYKERIRTDGKNLRRRYFPSDSVKKMKDVELAFFPTVVVVGQYYVIVFNLLKANAVILDNEKHNDYNKYKEVFDSVKVLFLKYLQKHQHLYVEKLSKDKPAKVLKMKWKTEKNKIESGLYMMMHMEPYQGESATN
nr:hypothetical protein [Tanacetum cinerariifolium]